MAATTNPASAELFAEAYIHLRCDPERAWALVSDLRARPGIISAEMLRGTWPERGAQARTVMDKGAFQMERIETVVHAAPPRRLLLSVDAPEHGVRAYLDHTLSVGEGGLVFGMSVLALVAHAPGEDAEARARWAEAYREGSAQALADALKGYSRLLT